MVYNRTDIVQMSFINHIIRSLNDVQDVCEAVKTAEKARIAALKTEASRKFEVRIGS